jgi:hypothetical protein
MEVMSFRSALAAAPRAVLTGVFLVASFAASASDITLDGTGQMYWTAQFLGSSSGNTQSTPTPTGTTPTGNTYTLGVPGQYGFIDQFAAPQSAPLVNSSNVPFENSGSPVGTYSFQDTYEFSVSAPAAGDVLAVSLALQGPLQSDFNISNLQFRLYEVPSSSMTPGLTIPTGSTVLTNWQGISGNDSGNAIQADFSNMQSGTYFLDIAGTADGQSGGTYIGQLNLNPVPLPPALPLLVCGLAGLGGMVRRRIAVA